MLIRLLATLFTALLCASAVSAQDPLDGVLSHRVIDGWQTSDGNRIVALEITLAPGWKTYWRSPGDAGIPPEFDWSGARNVADVHIHWPAPKVFWQSGMRSVGYSERVVLPLTVVPRRGDGQMRLRGDMSLGVCADICIPANLEIDALLDTTSGSRPPALVAALASLPYSGEEAGLRRAVCRVSPTDDGLEIEADLTLPTAGGTEAAVIEAPHRSIWVSEATATRVGGVLSVRAEMIDIARRVMTIDRSEIRITVIGSSHTVDIKGCTGR